MSRRKLLSYWLARIALNAVAVGVFAALVSLIGISFSFWLYWCAFAVYVTLSLGDTLINNVWDS